MAENITYPPYDAMLAGSTTNDTWSDGTQFSIGNTTYAWDSTPGLWRAFTTATSSSSGGGGLVLGEFFSQTVTTSTTSLTLDHTGPAWVFLTAGSGSGAVRVNTNPDPLDTGRGGNGGSGGFFLQDVSVLEGANVVLGTGGVLGVFGSWIEAYEFTTSTSTATRCSRSECSPYPWCRIPCVGSVTYCKLISVLWRIVGK